MFFKRTRYFTIEPRFAVAGAEMVASNCKETGGVGQMIPVGVNGPRAKKDTGALEADESQVGETGAVTAYWMVSRPPPFGSSIAILAGSGARQSYHSM